MGYLETGKATQSADFQLRVQTACFTAAQQILAEAEDTPNHTSRVQLARQVLVDPSVRVRQFMWLCASNPTISASVKVDADPAKVVVQAADTDIQYVVNSNWDDVAGWSPY